MRFKPGQKVVCTADGNNWYKSIKIDQMTFLERLKMMFKGNKAIGPSFNEEVTVANITQNEGAIPLVEYRAAVFGQYQESCFEPLVKTEVLEAELSEIFNKEKA